MNKKQSTFLALAVLAVFALTSTYSVMAASPSNHSPYLNPLSLTQTTAVVGQNMNFVLLGNDPDVGDTVIYGVEQLPPGAALNPSTGAFNWTATSSQAGDYPVIFTVSDGIDIGQLVTTLRIRPLTANQAPVLNEINKRTIEAGKTLRFKLTATDPDEDDLIFSSGNLPTGATLGSSTGEFNWPVPATELGTTTVNFSVTDGLASDTLAVMIEVIATSSGNAAPIIFPITDKTIGENEHIAFSLDANDQDGDTLQYSLAPLPAGATINSQTGAFHWLPTYTQAGTYNLIAGVSDGVLTATTSFKITVENQNRPPHLSLYHPNSVQSGAVLTINANGTDPDGDTLTYTINDNRFSQNATGTFTWLTATTTAGNFIFTVTATDGNKQATATANIQIASSSSPQNHAPVFNTPAQVSVFAGSNLDMTINASDPDDDTVSIAASNLPTDAQFSTTTRRLTWQPTVGQIGNHQINFLASDGQLTATHTLMIQVKQPDSNGQIDRLQRRLDQVEKRIERQMDRVQERLDRIGR